MGKWPEPVYTSYVSTGPMLIEVVGLNERLDRLANLFDAILAKQNEALKLLYDSTTVPV